MVAVATHLNVHPGLGFAEPWDTLSSSTALDDWLTRCLTEAPEVYGNSLGAVRACIDHGHAHRVIDGPDGKNGTNIPGERLSNRPYIFGRSGSVCGLLANLLQRRRHWIRYP